MLASQNKNNNKYKKWKGATVSDIAKYLGLYIFWNYESTFHRKILGSK